MGVESEINNVATGDGNPVAAQSGRTAADVVTPDLVARLTRGVVGSGRTANHTPLTGKKLADLPESTPQDVAGAFERAREAQPRLGRDARPAAGRRPAPLPRPGAGPPGRGPRPHPAGDRQGPAARPRGGAGASPSPPATTAARRPRIWAASGTPAPFPTLTKVTELRQPRGVVGQIAPWNYPLELSVGDALPAFVAGNAVVMKPDTRDRADRRCGPASC